MKTIIKIINSLLCLTLVVAGASIKPTALADCNSNSCYQKQLQDIQSQANANQKQITGLQDQINALNSQVAATNQEITITNQQIALTSKEIAQTQQAINTKTQELKVQKQHLFETMTVYYENSNNNQSTLETVIGSNSLSEAIDRAKYLEAISQNLNEAINKINLIMADLQTQNDNLQKQKDEQQQHQTFLANQERNLSIQNAQQQRLLGQAQAQQAQFKKDLDNVSSAFYAWRLANSTTTSSGGSGGYPYAGATPDVPDPWGFYTRECTSYAAWYWNNVEHKSWYNTRPGSGSAWNWPALAGDQGYGVYASPQIGDIVSWPAGLVGSYGHVAIVQQIFGDGTFVVSQYNWQPFAYSEMRVSQSLAAGARFIR